MAYRRDVENNPGSPAASPRHRTIACRPRGGGRRLRSSVSEEAVASMAPMLTDAEVRAALIAAGATPNRRAELGCSPLPPAHPRGYERCIRSTLDDGGRLHHYDVLIGERVRDGGGCVVRAVPTIGRDERQGGAPSTIKRTSHRSRRDRPEQHRWRGTWRRRRASSADRVSSQQVEEVANALKTPTSMRHTPSGDGSCPAAG